MRSKWPFSPSVNYLLAVLLAVFTYLYGLDGLHIPTNGDEMPYAHITRLTAASNHLLPLQSELDGVRNTKPPLLFWQGIATTHEGKDWSLWNLRYPSVIYTLLTALLVFLLASKLAQVQGVESGKAPAETGFVAALTFLAFFSTYRYGRPFLVNPAEVFWFFLPFFSLLYWRSYAFDSNFATPLLLGIEIGIGLLYKSFALVVPVGITLAWWYLHMRDYRWKAALQKDAWKVALTITLALSLFSLWFAFDPAPSEVWREFIVGENAGKFGTHGGSYWADLLWGGSSFWALLLGYPMNAGLLAFPVIGLAVMTFRRIKVLAEYEKLLWICLLVMLLIFSLPSQRSARYLLEGMPALAILCALNWQRISRGYFVASLLFAAVLLGLMGFFSWRLQLEMPHDGTYSPLYWLLLLLTAALILLAIFQARFSRALTIVVGLLMSLAMAGFLSPLDSSIGKYSTDTQRYMKGKAVWVPCDFRAVDESYRFLLPGAQVHGYVAEPAQSISELSGKYELFAVRVPLQEKCQDCKIVGQRLEMRGRHTPEQVQRMLHGEVFQQFFIKELLIEAPRTVPLLPLEEGCH